MNDCLPKAGKLFKRYQREPCAPLRCGFGLLALSFGCWVLVASSANGDQISASVSGTVTAIDNNSVMMLVDVDSRHIYGDTIFVKQWALDVQPEAMELLVLGRSVSCTIVYPTDAYLVGDCRVILDFIHAPSEFSYRVGSRAVLDIKNYAEKYRLGTIRCSKEDSIPPTPISGGNQFSSCLEEK